MQENFLHYLWQYQYFDARHLRTVDGEPLQVIHPGTHNLDGGADFLNANIIIGGVNWFGSVEIHIHSSEWHAHQHTQNPVYNNVVLHVVWKNNDTKTRHPDGSVIPTLELCDRTDPLLIEKYFLLSKSEELIACSPHFQSVKSPVFVSMLENALLQRLDRKATEIHELLDDNAGDWEETAYQWMVQHMGFKVNNAPFLRLSKTLSLKKLQKHSTDLLQLEALLFGQAGFLGENFEDDYLAALQKEYSFLAHKYGLQETKMQKHHWQFLRMRPGNFPTVRLAQLAALLHRHPSFLSLIFRTNDCNELTTLLDIEPSAYWCTHHQPGRQSAAPMTGMGKTSIEILLINAVVPLLVAYARHRDEPAHMERALHLLEQLPAEVNKITRLWKSAGLSLVSSFDTQGALELYNRFCTERKCLSCRIGNAVLQTKTNLVLK